MIQNLPKLRHTTEKRDSVRGMESPMSIIGKNRFLPYLNQLKDNHSIKLKFKDYTLHLVIM